VKKNKNVYLAQPWGGLGDNFVFSNLPRLYSEKNINFSLSFLNHERNRQIKNIVWKNNPYIKNSYSFNYPNIGSRKLNTVKIEKENFNVVQKINIFHGFEPGDGYPEIYLNHEPDIILKYEKVADLNAYSMFNTQEMIYDNNKIKNLKYKLNNEGVVFLEFPKLYKNDESFKNTINSKNINDLVKVLLSTETFYCLNSGSHCLAAILKNKFGYPKNIISYLPNLSSNNLYDFGHVYENVKYSNIGGIKNENAHLPRKIKIYQGLIKKYFTG
tara:strand:- start:904 stop:1716 length:813 start_codon:yes stop_codon:yes gene_type:complete